MPAHQVVALGDEAYEVNQNLKVIGSECFGKGILHSTEDAEPAKV